MSKPQTFIVHQATNSLNGKRYVGMTGRSIEARRKSHLSSARTRRGGKFAHAIRAYGIEAFKFETLRSGLTREEAAAEEIRLIAELAPEYNLSPGGEGVVNQSETQLAIFYEGRKKASERRKRPVLCVDDGAMFWSCAEAAQHYGISRPAITHALKREGTAAGKRFVYLAGVQEKKKPKDWRDVLRRPVVCLNDGKRYESIKAAAVAYGLPRPSVSSVVRRERPATSGLIFRYENDPDQTWPEGRPKDLQGRWVSDNVRNAGKLNIKKAQAAWMAGVRHG